MSFDLVAQKYSQAFFDAIPSESRNQYAQELAVVAKLFSDDSAKAFFKNPFNSLDNKLMVAKSSLEGRCSPEIFNFLVALVQKDRVSLVAEVAAQFQKQVSSSVGEIEGELIYASLPSESFIKEVEQKISHALNKKVRLIAKKDESLLAGYRVSVGGWTIDDSFQFHIKKLKENILKRG